MVGARRSAAHKGGAALERGPLGLDLPPTRASDRPAVESRRYRRGRGLPPGRRGPRRGCRLGRRPGVAGVVPGAAGGGAAGADRERHQHGGAGPVHGLGGHLLAPGAGRPGGAGAPPGPGHGRRRAAGAALLLSTPAEVFELLVPLLIGGASLVLLLQPGITRLAGGMVDERGPALLAGVFAVGVYAGYFGAAAGVVLLALLTVSVAEPLARLVAARNVALGLANAVAAIGFALFGPVRWAAAAPLAAGFLIGGGLGPGLVRRLPGGRLRVGDRRGRPDPGRQAGHRHLRPGRDRRVDCGPVTERVLSTRGAQPGPAGPPAPPRTLVAAPPRGPRAGRRPPGPVRPLAVRRPVVAAARLPPRRPHPGAGGPAGGPGDPAAGHHPRRLGRRLPAVHRGGPGRPPGVVGPRDPAASWTASTSRPPPPWSASAWPAGPARQAELAELLADRGFPKGGLDRRRALGRHGPGAAVGHLGAAPGRPVRPGRRLARAVAGRPGRRAGAPGPPLPGRLRPGLPGRPGQLGGHAPDPAAAGAGAGRDAAVPRRAGAELFDLPGAPLPDPEHAGPAPLPVHLGRQPAGARPPHPAPARAHRPRIFHVRAPHSFPTFLVDGAVAGTWRHEQGRVGWSRSSPCPPRPAASSRTRPSAWPFHQG